MIEQEREIAETIELEHPIVFGSKTVSTLEFSPIKTKHLRNLPPVSSDGTVSLDIILELMGKLLALPPRIVDEIQGNDLSRAMAVTTRFLEQCLGGIGMTSEQ